MIQQALAQDFIAKEPTLKRLKRHHMLLGVLLGDVGLVGIDLPLPFELLALFQVFVLSKDLLLHLFALMILK